MKNWKQHLVGALAGLILGTAVLSFSQTAPVTVLTDTAQGLTNKWFYDPADPTKKVKFDLSGITPGTLATITVTDAGISGGGTPGGSSGQLQYNNSGAFGGYTIGAGLNTSSGSLITDSTIANFLKSGALTCGAATQGKVKVHTTPLQYCDNAATPALQYAAYGDSSGNATHGSSVSSFFGAGFDAATTTGSKTTNNCAKWDSSGRVVDAGAGCGGAGTTPTYITVNDETGTLPNSVAVGTPLSPTLDTVGVAKHDGSAFANETIPNCADSGGNHLNFTVAGTTGTRFSCGTSSSGGGGSSNAYFSANKGGSNQTISAGTWTVVTFGTELYDSANYFASNKFTPGAAGQWSLHCQIYMGALSGTSQLAVSMNPSTADPTTGSRYKQGLAGGPGGAQVEHSVNTTALFNMNGSTDFAQCHIYSASTTINGGADLTYFEGK